MRASSSRQSRKGSLAHITRGGAILLAAGLLLSSCRKMGGLEGQPLDDPFGGSGARPATGAGGRPFGGGQAKESSGASPGSGGTAGSDGAGGLGSTADSGAPDAHVEPVPFSREALLDAFADCAVAETAQFARHSRTLADTTVELAASPSEGNAARARAAWQDAADHWQVLEVLQYGPAAMSSQPGGQELRDQIYVWPLFNRCLTEQLTVNLSRGDSTFATQLDRFAYVRGLGALDYVLFYPGTDNACLAANPINRDGTWAELVAGGGLATAKAAYARVTAEDVDRRARQLADAWEPTRGNFHRELARAGAGSTVFSTLQAGLNAVSDALFYLDTETKDMKLAAPLGLTPSCTTSPCPWLVESPFAGRSKLHVRNNLVGFRKVFAGCTGEGDLGFDDLLDDVGQSALADEMNAAVGAAIAAVDAIDEPSLDTALVGDANSVWALYDAVKALTDLLKTDFVTVLNFGRPPGAGTDND